MMNNFREREQARVETIGQQMPSALQSPAIILEPIILDENSLFRLSSKSSFGNTKGAANAFNKKAVIICDGVASFKGEALARAA